MVGRGERRSRILMTLHRWVHAPQLLVRAQTALGMSQQELGELLGCSRRTIVRYAQGDNGPSIAEWHLLARHVHEKEPDLAAEIARETGETLETLGMVQPAPVPTPAPALPAAEPRPLPPTRDLVDSIVCAAAEAVATTPQSIRPALRAAFERAVSVGVGIEEVRAELQQRGSPKAESHTRRPRRQKAQGGTAHKR
jgi:DNA-binding XRE family transcriptional regulator